jgi:hypothetical protein
MSTKQLDFCGVCAARNKWKAQLNHDGKQHYLGTFNTKQQAAAAYDKAVRQRRGPDAVCNFATTEEGDAAASLALRQWEQANMKPRPVSGFYGVTGNRQRWQARLRYDGKQRGLGYFNTKQQAAAAYDKAARGHKGANAVCNFATAEEGDAAAALALSEWEREHVRLRPASGFYGVTAKRQKWRAIYKGRSVGYFNTKQEAAVAYDEAARKLEGDNALFNFANVEEGIAAASMAASEWEREQAAAVVVVRIKPRPPSGFYGVTVHGGKWRVQVAYDGTMHYLGIFNTKQEAAVAYDNAARQHKGDNASFNFTSVEEGDVAAALAASQWGRSREHAAKTAAGMKPRAGNRGRVNDSSDGEKKPANGICAETMLVSVPFATQSKPPTNPAAGAYTTKKRKVPTPASQQKPTERRIVCWL